MNIPLTHRPCGSGRRASNGPDSTSSSRHGLDARKKVLVDRDPSKIPETPRSISPAFASRALLPSPGSAFPPKGTGILMAQLHRLLLAHFPFEDIRELNMWLYRAPVSSAWNDFSASVPPHADLPHKPTVVGKAVRAIHLSDGPLPESRFSMYRPDTRDWTVEDHYVRFIVVVLEDSLLEELWTLDEWSTEGPRIAGAVYEALVYMMGTFEFLEKNCLALDDSPGPTGGSEDEDEYPWEELDWESEMGEWAQSPDELFSEAVAWSVEGASE